MLIRKSGVGCFGFLVFWVDAKICCNTIPSRKIVSNFDVKMSYIFCRPTRNIKDITQLSTAGASHDCGSLSRVVMVRKTDQRVINHKGSQKVGEKIYALF